MVRALKRVETQATDPLLDVKQAARFLGISEWHVRALARAGYLPVYKLGAHLLFHPAELRRWVESGRPERTQADLTKQVIAEAIRDALSTLTLGVKACE